MKGHSVGAIYSHVPSHHSWLSFAANLAVCWSEHRQNHKPWKQKELFWNFSKLSTKPQSWNFPRVFTWRPSGIDNATMKMIGNRAVIIIITFYSRPTVWAKSELSHSQPKSLMRLCWLENSQLFHTPVVFIEWWSVGRDNALIWQTHLAKNIRQGIACMMLYTYQVLKMLT